MGVRVRVGVGLRVRGVVRTKEAKAVVAGVRVEVHHERIRMPHHTRRAWVRTSAEVRAEVMGDGRWVMVGMPSRVSHRWGRCW